jgi:hypothetical protein
MHLKCFLHYIMFKERLTKWSFYSLALFFLFLVELGFDGLALKPRYILHLSQMSASWIELLKSE